MPSARKIYDGRFRGSWVDIKESCVASEIKGGVAVCDVCEQKEYMVPRTVSRNNVHAANPYKVC